jgi:hypothetical protein
LTTLSLDLDIFSIWLSSSSPVAARTGCAVPRSSTVRRVVVLAPGVLVAVGQDHALVEQLLERLLGEHQAAVVEHLVPEAGVEQVQHRVLDAADVEIDRHPVLLGSGRPGLRSLWGR